MHSRLPLVFPRCVVRRPRGLHLRRQNLIRTLLTFESLLSSHEEHSHKSRPFFGHDRPTILVLHDLKSRKLSLCSGHKYIIFLVDVHERNFNRREVVGGDQFCFIHVYYLHHRRWTDGRYVFIYPCLSVLSVCEHDISRRYGQIRTTLGGQVGFVTRTKTISCVA